MAEPNISQTDTEESPIDELQQILSEAGDDAADLFAMALTVYAGVSANTKSPDQKCKDLERLILDYKKR
jgi:hypothetical protein